MDILKSVLALEEYIVKMRRHFHENPEVSGKEDETVKVVCAELEKMGIEYVDVPDGGVLGFINKDKPGKTVMLRGDLDALPMDEDPNNLIGPKVSVAKVKGACHACGHDAHTAMLLAAAKVVNDNKEAFDGKIVLMFERGEEVTQNYIVLHKYLTDNGIKVDSSYGNHLYSDLESGKIAIMDTDVMSGSCSFDFTIRGRGGHGSRPDLSISPLDPFLAIANAINTLGPRFVSPFHKFTNIIAQVHMGTQNNIIDETLRFGGGIRVYDHSDGVKVKAEMSRLVHSICESFNCTVDYELIRGPSFATVNDPVCAAMAREVVGKAIGDEKVIQVEPWMATESMSVHLKMFPGVFALLGIQNKAKGIGAAHHNNKFDVDEDVLKYGAAAAVAYAEGFLASDIDTSTSPNKWTGTLLELLKAASTDPARLVVLEQGERQA